MKRLLPLLTMFLFAASVQASIVLYEGPAIEIPNTYGGVYLNPATRATASSQPGDWTSGPWINFFEGGLYIAIEGLLCPIVTSSPSSGDMQVKNLASGASIDGSQTYPAASAHGSVNHLGPGADQFQANTPGYIGFKMQTSPTSDTYFGWMRVSFNDAGAGSILSYAYESMPGTGIAAGATHAPEPGRCLLLVLGCASILLRRKRTM